MITFIATNVGSNTTWRVFWLYARADGAFPNDGATAIAPVSTPLTYTPVNSFTGKLNALGWDANQTPGGIAHDANAVSPVVTLQDGATYQVDLQTGSMALVTTAPPPPSPATSTGFPWGWLAAGGVGIVAIGMIMKRHHH